MKRRTSCDAIDRGLEVRGRVIVTSVAFQSQGRLICRSQIRKSRTLSVTSAVACAVVSAQPARKPRSDSGPYSIEGKVDIHFGGPCPWFFNTVLVCLKNVTDAADSSYQFLFERIVHFRPQAAHHYIDHIGINGKVDVPDLIGDLVT